MSNTTSGSNTNTSGTNVANVGFWPKNLLAKLGDLLANFADVVKNVVSGNASAAAVDYSQAGGSDQLPDVVLEEIARRLIVTVEPPLVGEVQFTATAPDDHTKPWWPIDPVTGVPIGEPKKWDGTLNMWVPITSVFTPYVPPFRRTLKQRVAAGASTVTFTFVDVLTTNFTVQLAMTSEGTDGTFGAAPTFTSGFSWVVTDRTNTSIDIHFQGVPAAGLMADGFIQVIDY